MSNDAFRDRTNPGADEAAGAAALVKHVPIVLAYLAPALALVAPLGSTQAQLIAALVAALGSIVYAAFGLMRGEGAHRWRLLVFSGAVAAAVLYVLIKSMGF